MFTKEIDTTNRDIYDRGNQSSQTHEVSPGGST